jgi:dTDP-4-amino-4,6-dideoxygalactose transaminase
LVNATAIGLFSALAGVEPAQTSHPLRSVFHVTLLPRFYHVPLARPYWTGATFRAIIRCLLSAQVIAGPELRELKAWISEELGVQNAILCGSGSLALELALRSCDVKPGDEVVVPTFCCSSVIESILAVGACPVLADVGDELNLTARTVEPALTKRTRAIIVPHLFGNPAEIKSIMELARGRDIRIIDDAAQAVGASLDGQYLGTFGDAGILSFGNEKVCSGLGGGVFISRHREILEQGAEVELAAADLSLALRTLSSTLIWHRWRRWSVPLQEALQTSSSTDPESLPPPYRKESMSNLKAAVASSLMKSLQANLAARRLRVRAYQGLLGNERLILVPHRPSSACLTQVIRIMPKFSGHDPASDLIASLRIAGFEVQGSYIPIHLLAPYQHLAVRSFPHAEKIWTDLVELPCEPGVSLEQVERIVSIVKQTLRRS